MITRLLVATTALALGTTLAAAQTREAKITFFIWAGGITLGGWLLWRMIRHPEPSDDLLRS